MKYIVTGSTSGLGFAITDRLLRKGQVLGISRNNKKKVLCNNSRYTHVNHDLSIIEEESFSSLCESVNKFVDEDYVLVLNAASFYTGEQRLSSSELYKMFNINVFSLMKLVAGLNKKKLRRIFVVNSVSGLIGQDSQHEYSASKHAAMGYVRSLIKSSVNEAYDVMCINPGGMKTELWEGYEFIQTEDFLEPDSVADICTVLINQPGRMFLPEMVLLPPSDV